MSLTPEQLERLKETQVDFYKAWQNARLVEATERDVALAKLETLEALIYILGVDNL